MIKWGASFHYLVRMVQYRDDDHREATLGSEENGRTWKMKTITVLLRRMSGDNLNIPMFFGFVGMFIMLMFWPGLGK